MILLTTISVSQASKEVVVNENFIATGPAGLFGRKYSTTTGLTFGYYGGVMLVDGVLTTISDGTVALTASTTNYVEATRAGVVSKNTTGFTAGQIPLYTVVTGASSITSYTDQRVGAFRMIGRLSKSVAGSSDVTLTAAEAHNEILELTGALSGNINVIVPSVADQWTVFNNTSGAFTLTVKTSAGTGVAVKQGKRTLLYGDGTNVVGALGNVAALDIDGDVTLADAKNVILDAATGTKIATANSQKLGFWNATPVIQPAGSGQAAVTLGNTDNEIGGLTISAAYSQAEVAALRDKCEELADDVRALSTLIHALRTALGDAGLIKGAAPDNPQPRSHAALLAQVLSAWQPPPNLSQGRAPLAALLPAAALEPIPFAPSSLPLILQWWLTPPNKAPYRFLFLPAAVAAEIFADDLSFFFQLADFAVAATWTPFGGGAQQSAQVLLDAPDLERLGDTVLSREYAITYAAGQLPGLKTGETLSVEGVSYTVREVAALDDGALMRATLSKL